MWDNRKTAPRGSPGGRSPMPRLEPKQQLLEVAFELSGPLLWTPGMPVHLDSILETLRTAEARARRPDLPVARATEGGYSWYRSSAVRIGEHEGGGGHPVEVDVDRLVFFVVANRGKLRQRIKLVRHLGAGDRRVRPPNVANATITAVGESFHQFDPTVVTPSGRPARYLPLSVARRHCTSIGGSIETSLDPPYHAGDRTTFVAVPAGWTPDEIAMFATSSS